MPKLSITEYLKSKNVSPFNHEALEVAKAYSDCLPHNVDCEHVERNLRYFNPNPMNAAHTKVLLMAVVTEYNGFNAEKSLDKVIEFFGSDAEFFIAREHSVCLYVKPKSNVWFNRKDSDLADEVYFDASLGMFRLWWD